VAACGFGLAWQGEDDKWHGRSMSNEKQVSADAAGGGKKINANRTSSTRKDSWASTNVTAT
jgi:hypothetical protein